jgi:hypothetical protein
MQAVDMYRAERKAVQASIDILHVEIWRQGQQGNTNVSHLRQEISAHTTRLKTIEHVILWLKEKTE